MRIRALFLAGVCCAFSAAAPAGVHIVVKNGRKVIVNDGVGSTPREALGRSDAWLAARVAIPSLYDDQIAEAARANAIDPKFVKSVMMIESAFDPAAVSRKGARGLMQLMPATAAQLGVRNVFDVRQNIEGGVRHLRHLVDRYGGNLALALAAYNAGVEAVGRYGGIPPYPETQAYVARVLRLLQRAAPSASAETRVLYRYEAADGRVVYSNLPIDKLSVTVREMLAERQ